MARAQGLAEEVKAAEHAAAEAETASQTAWLGLSNIVDDRSPVGGEEDFRVLEQVGTAAALRSFEPRDHLELGELLGAIDVERAAKVSGARFFYLTGVGAQLELALLNLAMACAIGNGFTPMIPPALVSPAAMEGTGFLGQAAENVYHLEEDDMYLVGTAEVPLAALPRRRDPRPAESLPLRYVGFSPVLPA